MVDRDKLAAKTASIRDAVARVREVLPADVEQFETDRTIREVVVLNLFVAIQDAVDLATHWTADEGWPLPETYRQAFFQLAERGVLDRAVASAMADAAAFRNLVAHRYGDLNWVEVHRIAAGELGALEAFCQALAEATTGR
ncbi:MAG: DUF86 domain-containing protein [Deltaproteobacteria bacterium]|nr:DUF86 domain-containing protein [Deltaproteobacteria bacterium]